MLEELATGYLVTEGLISRREQILRIAVDPAGGRITAILAPKAGHAGASSRKMDATFRVGAEVLSEAMKQFRAQATGGSRPMGAHVAAVAQGAKILSLAEDIGRHNAMDKAVGATVMQGVALHDKLLLTTARVNREVVMKAFRAGFPVVATSRSTTTTAVDLARESSLTIAGFISASGMIFFSADWRVILR
jgi:FdhD protein